MPLGLSWISLLTTLIALGPLPALGHGRAVARNGNIFVLRSDGTQLQVTSSGVDSDPDLAADESTVVFLHKGNGNALEICIAETKTPTQTRVILRTPLEVNGRIFRQVYTPRFSPDSAVVYFLIPYAGTTQAIIKVAVSNPKPVFVAAALAFQVVPSGQYEGDLVAKIRKAKLGPGYYDWYWLLRPDGKEVGVVGQDEKDAAMFIAEQALQR